METRITQEYIDSLLDASELETHLFFEGKMTVHCYRLPNGFVITGSAGVIDMKTFDAEIGNKYAREDAANKLWKLEGYLLQNRLPSVTELTT